MSKTAICRIIPTVSSSNRNSNGAKSVVILEIQSSSGDARRLQISAPQTIKLEFGDKLKSLSGEAGVLINPGTPAGMFVLCPQVPNGSAWNVRTELEINEETVKHIPRGKISVAEDIGTVLTGGTAATR